MRLLRAGCRCRGGRGLVASLLSRRLSFGRGSEPGDGRARVRPAPPPCWTAMAGAVLPGPRFKDSTSPSRGWTTHVHPGFPAGLPERWPWQPPLVQLWLRLATVSQFRWGSPLSVSPLLPWRCGGCGCACFGGCACYWGGGDTVGVVVAVVGLVVVLTVAIVTDDGVVVVLALAATVSRW